jgi:beta-galactosidase
LLREATDPRWVSLAGAGAKLLVLEQAHPLRYLALPADLEPTEYVGRVAFAENLGHPVFQGLDQPDFFTWSKDHIVYRNVYTKATRGAVSLAHCDTQLGCSAISECPVNDGLIVVCQMVVGEKLAFDPVAQRLFDNMVGYCASYTPIRKSTAVVMAEDSPAAQLLAESGLDYDTAAGVVAAISDGKHDIVVFEASPANLSALAAAPAQLKAFTGRGGWLMAWGLTPEGLADFGRITGVEHVLRPFELERVMLPAQRDALLAGITDRDVAMESGERIFSWAGGNYMVADAYTYTVDLDDIAPFCEFPGATAGDLAAAREAVAGWPRNMVNGFTSADAWKLIYYMSTDSPRITLTLPRDEEVTGLSIVLNTHYAIATKVNLYFDDDPTPVALTMQTDTERQDFDLPARKARSLTIELADFDKQSPTTGIDNIWIRVARSQEWRARVRPLLNIGGLVKYPMGKGGLILNQLRIDPNESVPINAQKKRTIVSALLRNLHATYSGARVLTLANLKFQPVPLNEQCNQYLTKDRGWFAGNRDLSHLPIGEQRFAGVPYVVRDFRTSPVPSCVMLRGPGARGNLPEKVEGLQVGCRADALFFLHTLNRGDEWRPSRADEAPPAVLTYIIHYADGQTAEVPVLYGEGVSHWVNAQPAGLKSAALAWAARFPTEDSPDQAVLYQLQWSNPRPEVEIAAIDMAYGPAGSRYGTPALIAVTAGTAVE